MGVSSKWTADEQGRRRSLGTEAAPGDPNVRHQTGNSQGRAIPRSFPLNPELVMVRQPRSVAAERFRRLATVLANEHGEKVQILVVTSPTPAAGKSVVALNLALAFAGEPGKTLLVDADLRRPTVESWLIPPPALGLSEILARQADLEDGILDLADFPLRILPAGRPVNDPMKLLSSEEFRLFVTKLRGRFPRIIIDTPPILTFSDADAIAALSDGVLLVVKAGATSRVECLEAISSVTSSRVLGLVLNGSIRNLVDRHRNYESHYREYYRKDRER